jgi:hypothetical protein
MANTGPDWSHNGSVRGAVTAAYGAIDKELPKPIVAAQKLVEAVAQRRAAIEVETEPTIGADDLKSASDIDAFVDRFASYHGTREYRRKAIERVIVASNDVALMAWMQSAGAIDKDLAPAFADAAAKFRTALTAIGGETQLDLVLANRQGERYQDAVEAAATLGVLRKARVALSGRIDVSEQGFWKHSGYVAAERMSAYLEIDNRLRSHVVGQPNPDPDTVAWWAALLRAPGVTAIRWITAAEQRALLDTISRKHLDSIQRSPTKMTA